MLPRQMSTSRKMLSRPVTLTLARPTQAKSPRILLVHGTMDRASSFKRLARELEDFELISYDRRGYGESAFNDKAGNAKKLTWQIHLEDLRQIISEAPTVAFGHSYGGTLCLLAAAHGATNLIGVVSYEAPMPWVAEWARKPAYRFQLQDRIDPIWASEEASAFMKEMIGENSWARLPSSTKSKRRHEGVTMVSELSSMSALEPSLDPKSIHVPVMLVRSGDAPSRHVDSANFLASEIPFSSLEVISNTGHGVHLENPKAIAKVIRTFALQLGRTQNLPNGASIPLPSTGPNPVD